MAKKVELAAKSPETSHTHSFRVIRPRSRENPKYEWYFEVVFGPWHGKLATYWYECGDDEDRATSLFAKFAASAHPGELVWSILRPNYFFLRRGTTAYYVPKS